MALKRKNTKATPSSQRKQVIKVNPFENPENVMELMTKICSARPTVDIDIFKNAVGDAFDKKIDGVSFTEFIKQCDILYNSDFLSNLNEYCDNISWLLDEKQNTKETQIVVAGGFSSGKSSFINRITERAGLLPTGTEPVSVVKTYLYCSKDITNVSVKGVNLKNVLVDLNVDVLQAIQHANKSHIHLASVLDKLFVKVPSEKLDGLVFIDTPGYNNSDKVNDSNGKTDRETAIKALREGNVLFWFVDSDRATTTSDDLEIIKQFNGKKVIIFNKADKKGAIESAKIVEEEAEIIYNNFDEADIIDIIAYSTSEDRIYYSKNNLSMEQIVFCAKQSGSGKSEMESLKQSVSDLFDTEIHVSRHTLKGLDVESRAAIKRKNELYKYWQNDKEVNEGFLESIKDIMVDSYTTVNEAARTIYGIANSALSHWRDFHKEVLNFDKKDHWGSSSILDSAINKSVDSFNAINPSFYNFDWESYNEEFRTKQYNIIVEELEKLNSLYKDWYDEATQKCDQLKKSINAEEYFQEKMNEYKEYFLRNIEQGIKHYDKQNRASKMEKEIEDIPNIFDCIKNDNYWGFLRCFENGVDLSLCNPDGFNPLTLAVTFGNNMMVQFMLDHDADPSIKDKRGYNAFHTAVEFQFRDICTILLKADPDIIHTKTDRGESVIDLANKQTFTKWINKEIENAY